jgi:carbonic anhydrase
VIVRSSANIGAGARTRWSAVLARASLDAAVRWCFCAPCSRTCRWPRSPRCSCHVGVKLRPRGADFRRAGSRVRRRQCLRGDALGVVFLNLLGGIGIGFGLFALEKLLKRVSAIYVQPKETQAGEIELQIHGDLNFLAVPSLITSLRRVPTRRTVRMQFELDGLDHAAIDAIRAWRVGYENEGGTVHKPDLDFAWRKLTGQVGVSAPRAFTGAGSCWSRTDRTSSRTDRAPRP